MLSRDSEVFRDMLGTLPAHEGQEQGLSDENPIVLPVGDLEGFAAYVWALYAL